ncbi:MAG: tetratricopeptide repeat protein [Spirochaetaceae bacterium]|jgi:tetratricopeptide (TPR) repeat protein|nr:tetratricopeptide repeat protein [Spirochaetaceae bacterium]
MESGFQGAVQQAVGRYGLAVLDDPARCGALLSGFAKGEHAPCIRLFTLALKEGLHTEIAKSSDLAMVKGRLTGILENRHLIAPQAAEEIILLLGTLYHKHIPATPAPHGPGNAEFSFNRGVAYYYQEDYDRAIDDFTEALRVDPNFAYAKYGLEQARKARERGY